MELQIKKFRQSKNLTQSEVAKKIGVSPSAFAMYERGEREPGITKLCKLADFFDVSIDYLVRGKGKVNKEVLEIADASAVANLGDIETELINICSQLDMKRKNMLLTKAYEILEDTQK